MGTPGAYNSALRQLDLNSPPNAEVITGALGILAMGGAQSRLGGSARNHMFKWGYRD